MEMAALFHFRLRKRKRLRASLDVAGSRARDHDDTRQYRLQYRSISCVGYGYIVSSSSSWRDLALRGRYSEQAVRLRLFGKVVRYRSTLPRSMYSSISTEACAFTPSGGTVGCGQRRVQPVDHQVFKLWGSVRSNTLHIIAPLDGGIFHLFQYPVLPLPSCPELIDPAAVNTVSGNTNLSG